MKTQIRKNDLLPAHLDPERFEAIFWHIREHPGQPQSKRVEEVLELISTLGHGRTTLEKAQNLARLRRCLSVYKWGVKVSYTKQGFHPTHVIADSAGLSREDIWEYGAIRDLLDVVPYLGKRPRIRRCAECEKWFFATNREDQQYCGGNCRQHHYDSDPATRIRKKLKMREHRIEQKKREERRREALGRRSTVKWRE